jgi:hypothetical protein
MEFWGYFTSIDINGFSGYYISYGKIFKIEMLRGISDPKVSVSFYGNKNYNLTDKFPLNQWYYHKATINFDSYIKYNTLTYNLENVEYPYIFDSNILFSSLNSNYERNHSIYIKNFRLWKAALGNNLDTSRM